MSHTNEHTEISHLFPDCTVLVQSTDESEQVVVSPPQTEHATQYCSIIAEYVETYGFTTEIEHDAANQPYVRAQPLPIEQRKVLTA